MMNFSWVSVCGDDAFKSASYDVAFVGTVVDDRGAHCLSIATRAATKTLSVSYVPSEYKIHIDGRSWRANEVENIALEFPAKNILFDATTLDFPDLLLIIRGYLLRGEAVRFYFLYAEPHSYNSATGSKTRHEFQLSDSYASDYYPIPGFISLQTNPNSVGSVTVFVGFEGARLRNLIADSEPEVLKRFNIVFGIPPFKTEWETHSLMENASILLDQQVEEILYAGANNPYSCYEVLLMLYKTRDYNSSFEVAPLGTKPAAIASALFAAEHRGVSVRYDYPRRSQGRSSGVGKVHLFTAWCDGDVGD
ncbi:hypothetical protein [Pseudomonas sp. Z18(2022)]|uniref:hypothetical protein n=1 Tax=Pseudomonas sp. Z18(2022) TaxID=2983410 RepID=UPI002E81D071|nr:hypothetical protein [Pseudomonas sp. Z18(2022)]